MNDITPYADLDAVEFADNPEPRCAVVLLLDVSGSMQGRRIDELNVGLQTFERALKKDPLASLRVELAVVAFGGRAARVLDVRQGQGEAIPAESSLAFVTVDGFHPPLLVADGSTPMGEAARIGLQLIRDRKATYKQNGIDYFRPWLFLITDGKPTDSGWEAAAAELQAPLVFVTAHVGALYLLAAGLDRLWTQRLAIRWSALHQTAPGEDSAFTSGPVVSRTEALRRGLEGLRQGKIVVTALEGPHGSAEPGRLLGRRLDFGRGGFALARLAGVRIAPVAALWERGRVRIDFGRPVEATAEAPVEMARWFEALLRRSPRQMSLGLLRQLLQSPALEPPDEDTSGV